MEKIPFESKDSELKGWKYTIPDDMKAIWEYTIPDGMEAAIEGNKVIVREVVSEDERVRKELLSFIESVQHNYLCVSDRRKKWIAYLEKQKDASKAIEAVERIDKYIDEHTANAHDMKDSHPDKKYYRGWDDALGKMSGILQDVYSGEKQKEQKSIKMEVDEVSKGTTIYGQDYKCKKDYITGTCRYIKDAMYHCNRDGYLSDQRGVSWSCTPEWFNEYIYSNTELAEEEKNRFVSGQFLQCKLSFDEFKEGEHYWLEYVGDDMYVGRSDNILNQKFHITPRQLYALFSQKLDEKQKEQKPKDELTIQHSWYMEGYYDRKFGKEPKWIIKTGEGGPKYELNPRYGYPLADEQKPVEHLKAERDGWYVCIKDYYHGGKKQCSAGDLVQAKGGMYMMGEEDISEWFRRAYYEDVRDAFGPNTDTNIPEKPVDWDDELERCKKNPLYFYDKYVKVKFKPAEWREEDIKKIRSEEYTKGFNDAAFGSKLNEWSEEDEKVLDCIINVLDRLGFEEYCESSRDQDVEEERFYYKEIQVLKKLKSLCPQTKQEWSEEDYHWEGLVQLLRDYQKTIDRQSNNMAYEDVESYISWIKSIPLNLKKKNEDVAKLCSNEWSEEDIECYNSISNYLQNQYVPDSKRIKCLYWLKSLRPSWKPTEEQMKALDRGLAELTYGHSKEEIRPLEELFEDLNNLVYDKRRKSKSL